jgi:hypothetical protein
VGDDRIEARLDHGSAGLLIGSPRPIEGLRLVFAPGVEIEARLGWRRVHPMWWTKEPYYLYPVALEPALRGLPQTLAPGEWIGFQLALE